MEIYYDSKKLSDVYYRLIAIPPLESKSFLKASQKMLDTIKENEYNKDNIQELIDDVLVTFDNEVKYCNIEITRDDINDKMFFIIGTLADKFIKHNKIENPNLYYYIYNAVLYTIASSLFVIDLEYMKYDIILNTFICQVTYYYLMVTNNNPKSQIAICLLDPTYESKYIKNINSNFQTITLSIIQQFLSYKASNDIYKKYEVILNGFENNTPYTDYLSHIKTSLLNNRISSFIAIMTYLIYGSSEYNSSGEIIQIGELSHILKRFFFNLANNELIELYMFLYRLYESM